MVTNDNSFNDAPPPLLFHEHLQQINHHTRMDREEHLHVNDQAQHASAKSSTEATGVIKESLLEHCVICLCPITERGVAVPCNHYAFDFLCLASWLEQRSACPLCNTELTAIEYDFASPEDFKTYSVKPTTKPTGSHTSALPASSRAPTRPQRRPYSRRPWGVAGPSQDPDIALVRRRYVYKHKLHSLHVGSNRVSRYRDFTPAQFSNSSDLQSRARQWLRRELQVFSFLDSTNGNSAEQSQSDQGSTLRDGRSRQASNAEFLLSYLIAILKTVDIKGSAGQAEDMLQEFLGRENAELFLHELNAWLRSPFTKVQDWDRHVQYSRKLPGMSAGNYSRPKPSGSGASSVGIPG